MAIPNTDCVFNFCMCHEIIKIHGRPVLHAVDRDTKFSAAGFLLGKVATKVGIILRKCGQMCTLGIETFRLTTKALNFPV